MLIKWSEELATGFHEIDNQHKEIFKRADKLAEACRSGKGKDEIDEVFLFLNDYVLKHFGQEEDLMQKFSYPGYGLHKVQHRKFLDQFTEMKNRLESSGRSSELAIQANVLLMDWLAVHIKSYDKSLGVFLRTRVRP